MCVQANGLLSSSGNPHTLTGALMEFPSFSDTLSDVRTSNDTRVTIDNNAAAISALAGLNEASGSWDQCLQVSRISQHSTSMWLDYHLAFHVRAELALHCAHHPTSQLNFGEGLQHVPLHS
jgi:hypothetical protein